VVGFDAPSPTAYEAEVDLTTTEDACEIARAYDDQ
jgi:hypothetical protein